MKYIYLRWTLKLATVLTLLILALIVGKNPVYALDVGCDVTALRAAIASANILDLSPGCVYEITDSPPAYDFYGPTGLPVIGGETTINGHGATIKRSGDEIFRLFAISNTGILTINQVTLTGGRIENPREGGAIYNQGGVLNINDTTIDNNRSGSNGGAISSRFGTVNITNSTISNNWTNDQGAILTQSVVMNITNSTIYGNHTDYAGIIFASGTTTITHSTFANNHTNQPSWLGHLIYNTPNSVTHLRNSIMADNSPYNCYGGVIDEGGNLDAYASCITSPISKSNANANLGQLGDNGGPTLTMALLPGSDALDFGLNDYCPSTDQRGIQRPQGTACDSGAYELVALNLLVVTIDIKPGSTPNCFNNNGKGAIPVAILSSNSFDATQVDPSKVSLNGQTVKVAGKSDKYLAHTEDVNTDGLMDTVVQIADTDGTYTTGDTIATLIGKTYDGQNFQGTDSICIVP